MGLSSKEGREYKIHPAVHHTEIALIFSPNPQRCDLSVCAPRPCLRHCADSVPEEAGAKWAGYTRHPATVLMFEELEWHSTNDERVIRALVQDREDEDYGWIADGTNV
jgi:hypothetical protein